MNAPGKCPMCGEYLKWKKVDEGEKWSVGKAAIGTIIFGPLGLLGGFIGDKKATYHCGNCNFQYEYDVPN